MKVLVVFNHPAPYKVKQFNELAKLVDLTVIFERDSASDRPASFYANNNYQFSHMFLLTGYYGKENSRSNELRNYLKIHAKEFDHIIMNGYSTSCERKAIKYLHKERIPFILMINGGVIHKETFIKSLYKKSYISKACRYLSPNVESNKYLLKYGAKQNLIDLYPYSSILKSDISTAKLTEEEKVQILNEYNLPNKGIIICPNQFIKRKNNLVLIEYFKDLPQNLVLVGNGPLKHKYERIIKRNHLKNVFIINPVTKEKLFSLYKASDGTISLSKEDIFGHTVIESFACGTPVIASSDIIAAKTSIINGNNGFIVDPNNKECVIEAISNIKSIDFDNCVKTAQTMTLDLSALKIKESLK